MKKPKSALSSPEDAPPSDLYQNVISLDKSDEDAASLLDSVFDLLHLRDHDIAFPESFSEADPNSPARPTSKWALRWLLNRLAIRTEGPSDLGIQWRAWMLFNHLIRVVPYNAVNQLLKAHDILDILTEVVEKLREFGLKPALLETSVKVDDGEDDDEKIQQQRESFRVNLKGILETTPTIQDGGRKRKRTVVELGRLADFTLGRSFYYIVEAFRFLQADASQRANGEARRWEREAVLTAKPIQCVRILASGLDVFTQISRSVDDTTQLYNNNLIGPLIQLYEQGHKSTATTNVDAVEMLVLDTCSRPALVALQLLIEGDHYSSKLKLVDQLQGLVARTTIHPYRTWCQTRERDHKSDPTLTNASDTDVSAKFRQIFGSEDLSPLFEVAFNCVQRQTALQRSKEDPWLQELFSTLYQSCGSRRLLGIANANKLQLSSKRISTLLGSDLNEADNELVQLCLLNNPTCFTSIHIGAIPTITGKIFKYATNHRGAISRPPVIACSEMSHVDTSCTTVLENICLPLLHAFATARDLESFLMLWSQHLEEGFAASELEIFEYLQQSIWTDDRLLTMLTLYLKDFLSITRRLELLETWTEAMEESNGDITEQQSLILASCIIQGIGESELKPLRISSLPERIAEIAWQRLESDTSSKHSESNAGTSRWRYWRLLFDLIDTRSLLMDRSAPLSDVKGIKYASRLLRKQLGHAGKHYLPHETSEGSFAWVFLLRSVTLLDPTARNPEAVKLIQAPWVKMTTENTLLPEEESRHWLAMECLLYSLDAEPSSAWLNVIFTSEILSVIQQNAYREGARVWSSHDNEDPIEPRLKWSYCWSYVSTAQHRSFDTDLSRRVTKLKLCALTESPAPGEQGMNKFSVILRDIDGVKLGNIGKKARADVASVITKWLNSGLLARSRSRQREADPRLSDTFWLAHGLLHRMDESSAACSDCNALERQKVTANEQTDGPDQTSIADRTLNRVKALIEQCKSPTACEKVLPELKAVFWETQDKLRTCLEPGIFARSSSALHKLLKARQLPLIGQLQVDELFAMTCHIASRDCVLAPGSPDTVYLCLCRLIGDLLSDYRHRVSGRYHLVLDVLKSLLWCLFDPHLPNQQPNWVASRSTPLSLRCAEDFSRLLTSLGDPTVSAARVGNKKSILNDPTKKARSIAGQHLSQLIVSFCSFQLRGKLDPELRAKINPGLWAIMDAASQDVMQNINAAMGQSERAIFKILYDDWKRFGKWQGT